MRIAVVLDHWRRERGGLEVYLDRVLPRLADGHDAALLARGASKGPPPRVQAIETRARTLVPRPWRDRADARLQVEIVGQGDYDRAWVLRRTPIPGALWQPHDGSHPHRRVAMGSPHPTWRERVLEALDDETLATCSRLLAVSPKVAREMGERRPGLPFDVLPPPLPDGLEPPSASPPPGAVRVLFCGQDARRKGADLALAWFRAFRRRVGDASLTCWSRSVSHLERVLGAGAREMGIEGVELRGWDGTFEDALRRAHLLLLPSHYDPCALVGVEAAAAGVPVLTTAQNGFSELAPDPLCAVAPRDDPESAADRAVALLDARRQGADGDFAEAVEAHRARFGLERHLVDLERLL